MFIYSAEFDSADIGETSTSHVDLDIPLFQYFGRVDNSRIESVVLR